MRLNLPEGATMEPACRRHRERIAAAEDPSAAAGPEGGHSASCPACQAWQARLLRLQALLEAQEGSPLPVGFAEAARRRLHSAALAERAASQARSPRRAGRHALLLIPALAAAAALAWIGARGLDATFLSASTPSPATQESLYQAGPGDPPAARRTTPIAPSAGFPDPGAAAQNVTENNDMKTSAALLATSILLASPRVLADPTTAATVAPPTAPTSEATHCDMHEGDMGGMHEGDMSDMHGSMGMEPEDLHPCQDGMGERMHGDGGMQGSHAGDMGAGEGAMGEHHDADGHGCSMMQGAEGDMMHGEGHMDGSQMGDCPMSGEGMEGGESEGGMGGGMGDGMGGGMMD